jgi:hypothetical protein
MKRMRMSLFLCAFLCAISLPAQTVKVNWRMGAHFSSYKTYAWQDPKNPGLPFYGTGRACGIGGKGADSRSGRADAGFAGDVSHPR